MLEKTLEGPFDSNEIEPVSLMSPAWAGIFFTTSTTWEAQPAKGVITKEEEETGTTENEMVGWYH